VPPSTRGLSNGGRTQEFLSKLLSTVELTSTHFIQALQIAGWILTVLGQIQIGLKSRQGFVTWIASNVVLIALCAAVGLWWSIGMYLTNVGVCIWSYRRWVSDEQPLQPLAVKRSTRWSARWN